MARTTIDIDDSVLADVRRLAERNRASMGRTVSELLAQALAGVRPSSPPELVWEAAPMSARVDLDDKDAVQRLLDDR